MFLSVHSFAILHAMRANTVDVGRNNKCSVLENELTKQRLIFDKEKSLTRLSPISILT